MKRLVVFLALTAILLSACNPGTGSQPAGTSPADKRTGPCGDGVCSGPENASSCPADCAVAAVTKAPVQGQTPVSASTHDGVAPLFMTTMTHMEHNFTDDKVQAVFEQHVEQLTRGMDLADEYGAKLTIESEQPFALANKKWNLNFMRQIVERGHGVGTHCDFGFRDELMSVEQYSRYFVENKSLVDALVGPENNLGCSGGGGANDWAIAAGMAGFKYLDGIVGMHYLAMPLENRPDASWTDDFIRKEGYHNNSPVDMYERIYPFGVADARDFVPDPNPVIVVSSGELGPLAGMAEGVGEIGGGSCKPECALNNADVDALVKKIQEISQKRDPARVAKLTVYLPANIFVPENEAVLRYFFGQMQALQDQGVLTWVTQLQVYETYVDWNQ